MTSKLIITNIVISPPKNIKIIRNNDDGVGLSWDHSKLLMNNNIIKNVSIMYSVHIAVIKSMVPLSAKIRYMDFDKHCNDTNSATGQLPFVCVYRGENSSCSINNDMLNIAYIDYYKTLDINTALILIISRYGKENCSSTHLRWIQGNLL